MLAAALQHYQANRLSEAERLCRQILAADPRHAGSLHLLGMVARQQGQPDLAIDLIRQAIAIENRNASYHSNLGITLAELGRLEEAVVCYRRALDLCPDYPAALNNLGTALKEQGLLEEAIACCHRALALRPDLPEVHNNLGIALVDRGQLDEAVACYRRALDLRPNYAAAHSNLGIALAEQGRLAEAGACYRRALEFQPDFPDAHHHLAMTLLASGDMAAGWQEYEWRWQTPQVIKKRYRSFTQPQWRGEAAAGRRLLIHPEQGFGDTLQFCRYAPLAAARGLLVTLEVQQPLVRLLRSLPGIERVIAHGEKLPDFDLHCPMLSLPLAMATTLATIPAAIPYLRTDAKQVAAWRSRLAATGRPGLRVGLAWAGNPLTIADRKRSLDPGRLAPWFDLPGLHFVSLQKDGPAAPGRFPLTDLMAEMADFADTAALIANLDLVIAVDTAVAHLAAALGRPVWLLDRFHPCWRWLAGRQDSPWYPTLRLFRQPRPGDWQAVIETVTAELSRLAAGRPAPTAAPDIGRLFATAQHHHGAGRLEEAAGLCRQVLAINARHADSLNLLGMVACQSGRFDIGVNLIGQAIAIDASVASYHANLGAALKEQGRLDEAVVSCRRALDLGPDNPYAFNNLGATLVEQGLPDEAIVCFRRAIALRPDYPEAHFNLAGRLLARGELASGWQEYEWRWRTVYFARERRNFAQPQWRGEAAAGRTLLIHAEQGFGDTIQFCRYAPLAAARGLRVILEVPPPLVRLLRSLPGVDLVVGHGEELPAFDLHCPMLSLPLAMATTLATIPAAIPYLEADPAAVAAWRTRLAAIARPGPRVGVVWAGSPAIAAMDPRRSIAPALLAPLVELPGVHFISLQKEGPAAPGHFPLTDPMAEMTDFADTAALVANLDLVISVDTAVAHLAAALGRPVWLLDRFDHCWRWLDGRDDSPWYPTLRLFRQPQPGDWPAVLETVTAALARFIAARPPATGTPEAQALHAAALTHHRAGRLDKAVASYRGAIDLRPDFPEALSNLGAALMELGRRDEAAGCFRRVLDCRPDFPEAHFNLGTIFREQGQPEQAIACYRRAIECRPDYPDAENNLGALLKEQGLLEDAVACFRNVLDRWPDFPKAHNNLGNALREQGRPEQAIACYRRALDLGPESPEAYSNLGSVLAEQGELDEAIACFHRALALRPNYPGAHNNLAMALLAQGELAAGWKEFEWRWQTPQMLAACRNFPRPQWHGEAAAGRILLIHAEQGFGDTLQFCRYATLAAARGLRVILEVPPPLVRLLRSLPGVDLVLGRGEKLPDFDLHCPMLSLPLAMATTLATIPAGGPYLQADPSAVAAWRTRLAAMADQGPRIGLVWAGKSRSQSSGLAAVDRRRSIDPALLAPLLEFSGVHFISLQKEGPAAPGHFPLTDPMAEITDFADTAALVANLDLIISVDTAVAHLAAALGRPVWLLDRFDPCWRWLRGREDSPWYPTLRLFRQPQPGNWSSVIATVTAALDRRVATRQPTTDAPAVRDLFAAALDHHQGGRLDQAEHLYRQVLAADSRHADGLHLLGMVACQTGRRQAGIEMIRQAIASNPGAAAYHSTLGTGLAELGQPDQAAVCFHQALKLRPDFPEAHANLGYALRQLGRLDEAVASLRRALDLRPDFPEAHNHLGMALAELGRLDEATACYRSALALRPDFLDAENNLGNALQEQGQLDAAVACLRRVLDRKPDYPDAHSNLGAALQGQGRPDEAIACYRRTLDFKPDCPEAHYNLAMALLACGDLAAGWQEYEWRWQTPTFIKHRRRFVAPQWRGEAAAGRTLLIHAEQGFGDTLQFCRYATLAAARGLRVTLEVQPPLVRLLRSLPGIDLVLGRGEPLPDFDLHCPMLSLPLAMATALATIPGATPYLHADPAQVAAWRSRLAAMAGTGKRVGLVWAGNPRRHLPALAAVDRRRSIAPALLAPLLELPGVDFISLQKDGPAAPDHFRLTDPMAEMSDFADTAALVANLDLVISVDTASVHLAAALGRPVWLLDRFDPCWRWLRGRDDSPWYPTLRLFRQPQPGDWQSVIETVAAELRRRT